MDLFIAHLETQGNVFYTQNLWPVQRKETMYPIIYINIDLKLYSQRMARYI